MIKETPAVDSPLTENIPEELKRRPQWVCWRLETRDAGPTKVPYAPKGGRASTTDLMSWGTFEVALEEYRINEGLYSGIGFVFCSADPFAGIDLDNCRDPETGKLEPWAAEIVASADEGYAEVSPSGTGVHIIVEGVVRGGGMRKGPVEMYSRGRFFTMTGRVL